MEKMATTPPAAFLGHGMLPTSKQALPVVTFPFSYNLHTTRITSASGNGRIVFTPALRGYDMPSIIYFSREQYFWLRFGSGAKPWNSGAAQRSTGNTRITMEVT